MSQYHVNMLHDVVTKKLCFSKMAERFAGHFTRLVNEDDKSLTEAVDKFQKQEEEEEENTFLCRK